MFDVILALLGLTLLTPLFIVIGVVIKLDSSGSIFYRAPRVGRYGEIFRLYKFRTMIQYAATLGPGITAAGDTRVTRVGRFLRDHKLDELPQLINVLKGEMSLVGPRPEDPIYVSHYTDEQQKVLRVRPGITSHASLAYRNEESLLDREDWERVYKEEILPHKLRFELDYLENRSVFSDVGLIVQTLWKILRH